MRTTVVVAAGKGRVADYLAKAMIQGARPAQPVVIVEQPHLRAVFNLGKQRLKLRGGTWRLQGPIEDLRRTSALRTNSSAPRNHLIDRRVPDKETDLPVGDDWSEFAVGEREHLSTGAPVEARSGVGSKAGSRRRCPERWRNRRSAAAMTSAACLGAGGIGVQVAMVKRMRAVGRASNMARARRRRPVDALQFRVRPEARSAHSSAYAPRAKLMAAMEVELSARRPAIGARRSITGESWWWWPK